MSLSWFLALAIVAIPIKFTGDFAYETTAAEPWMNQAMARTHEHSADQATTVVFALGTMAGIGLFLGRGGRAISHWVYILNRCWH